MTGSSRQLSWGFGRLRRWAVVSLALFAGGCETMGYYTQSVHGQLDMMSRRRPVTEVVADPDSSEPLRQALQKVQSIRDFASDELALPDNGSYRSYADLERSAAVWAVVATPELSLSPRQWCYPVIGCASYRGYFDPADAERYADGLREQGLDVVVEAVPAYSTLGWFDDPVPSTIVFWPEPRLAGLVFHELAHQQLYVTGDSGFNEAFATAVQEAGVRRWLRARGDPEALADWQLRNRYRSEFAALLLNARDALAGIYTQPLPAARKRELKAQTFTRLKTDYRDLKAGWGGYNGFDNWFARDLNNASLASVATYREWVPAFRRLLCDTGNDMEAFYRLAAEVGALPPDQRSARLRRLRGNQ